MSREKNAEEDKKPEVKSADKKEEKPSAPTDRDHYVYESIIAEIGY